MHVFSRKCKPAFVTTQCDSLRFWLTLQQLKIFSRHPIGHLVRLNRQPRNTESDTTFRIRFGSFCSVTTCVHRCDHQCLHLPTTGAETPSGCRTAAPKAARRPDPRRRMRGRNASGARIAASPSWANSRSTTAPAVCSRPFRAGVRSGRSFRRSCSVQEQRSQNTWRSRVCGAGRARSKSLLTRSVARYRPSQNDTAERAPVRARPLSKKILEPLEEYANNQSGEDVLSCSFSRLCECGD